MYDDVNYYFSYEGQEYFINISEGVPYLFVLHPDDTYDLCDYPTALNYGLCLPFMNSLFDEMQCFIDELCF